MGCSWSCTVTDVCPCMAIGIGGDTPIFADGKVISFGQVIGVIVAKTQPLAQQAAKKVGVVYEDLPSVITIEVGGRREEGGRRGREEGGRRRGKGRGRRRRREGEGEEGEGGRKREGGGRRGEGGEGGRRRRREEGGGGGGGRRKRREMCSPFSLSSTVYCVSICLYCTCSGTTYVILLLVAQSFECTY